MVGPKTLGGGRALKELGVPVKRRQRPIQECGHLPRRLSLGLAERRGPYKRKGLGLCRKGRKHLQGE